MGKKWRPGDVFRIDLPSGEPIAGRVLLNVKDQCIKPGLLPATSPLVFFGDTLLQEVFVGPTAEHARLIHCVFTWRHKFPLLSSKPVIPEALAFPQALSGTGTDVVFKWGELALPIPLTGDDVRVIDASPSIQGGLDLLALHALGRTSEIDQDMFPDPSAFSLTTSDLRCNPSYGRVRALLGGRVSDSYYATALRYGYDAARFYGAEHQSREWVLCAYCMAPAETVAPACATCGAEAGRDAPFEMTAVQMAMYPRVRCPSCRTPILSGAVTCPGCLASM